MNKRFAVLLLCFFLVLGSALHSSHLEAASAASLTSEKTLVLYDTASGTIPGAPLMDFIDFPPDTAQPTFSNGATVLDTTTSSRDTYAGWISEGANTPGFPILDRTTGFHVDFTLQIEGESHSRNTRSGFSLIVLGEDTKGIELAFWENEIWAQSDNGTGGLFQHGEGVVFSTTTSLIEYRLSVTGDTYTLTANAQPILSGPLRDYSAFDGFPDPYETTNFLFLGDNTTSAQARVRLYFVSVTGAEQFMQTGTSTATSTSVPLPTASPAPLPSVKPVPSQVPAGNVSEFCPSSWALLAVIVTVPGIVKAVKARHKTGRANKLKRG